MATPRLQACKDNVDKFFKNIFDTFHSWFAGVDGWIDAHVVPILTFVNGLKNIVEGVTPELDSLFPGFAPALLTAIDGYLTEICTALQIEISCSKNTDGSPATMPQRLACIAAYLNAVHPELRNALEMKIASWLTRLTAGETQFTGAEIDAMVQLKYTHMANSKVIAPAVIAAPAAPAAADMAPDEIDRLTKLKAKMIADLENAPLDAIEDGDHGYWIEHDNDESAGAEIEKAKSSGGGEELPADGFKK